MFAAMGMIASISSHALVQRLSAIEPFGSGLLLDWLPATGGPLLDLGCGAGRHLAELARRGIAAVGLDLSPEDVCSLDARTEGWIAGLRAEGVDVRVTPIETMVG